MSKYSSEMDKNHYYDVENSKIEHNSDVRRKQFSHMKFNDKKI
jgi:hypothetical protein